MAPPTNISSNLLDYSENQLIFQLIGERCVTLSTAVVQLYKADRQLKKWHPITIGVACFTRDGMRKAFYIQVLGFLFVKKGFNSNKHKKKSKTNFWGDFARPKVFLWKLNFWRLILILNHSRLIRS